MIDELKIWTRRSSTSCLYVRERIRKDDMPDFNVLVPLLHDSGVDSYLERGLLVDVLIMVMPHGNSHNATSHFGLHIAQRAKNQHPRHTGS